MKPRNVIGIGGTIMILRAKYDCARGEKLRCIGEKKDIWQFEGKKSAPKNHEGQGYRWLLDGEDAGPEKEEEAPKSGSKKRKDDKNRDDGPTG